MVLGNEKSRLFHLKCQNSACVRPKLSLVSVLSLLGRSSEPVTVSPVSSTSTAHTADLVVFGGTGDLSMRKLIPALYHTDRDGRLSPETRVIAMSRGGLTDA